EEHLGRRAPPGRRGSPRRRRQGSPRQLERSASTTVPHSACPAPSGRACANGGDYGGEHSSLDGYASYPPPWTCNIPGKSPAPPGRYNRASTARPPWRRYPTSSITMLRRVSAVSVVISSHRATGSA